MNRCLGLLAVVFCLSLTRPAWALQSTPVGGAADTWLFQTKVELERGLIEPNENTDSYQDARWNIYSLQITYTLGDVGFMEHLYGSVGTAFFTSPAEEGDVPSAQCLGTVLSANRCRFHPRDEGVLLRAGVGFDLIHRPDLALGLFLLATVPINVDLDKFANPRVDNIAGGFRVGMRLQPWLRYESSFYLGTGPVGAQQNGTVAALNRMVLETDFWGLHWGAKVGPYFDGDTRQRRDRRYDAAYTAGFPNVSDRIRMMRFGLSSALYAATNHWVVEAGYLQKLFGYDTPATQFFDVALSFSP